MNLFNAIAIPRIQRPSSQLLGQDLLTVLICAITIEYSSLIQLYKQSYFRTCWTLGYPGSLTRDLLWAINRDTNPRVTDYINNIHEVLNPCKHFFVFLQNMENKIVSLKTRAKIQNSFCILRGCIQKLSTHFHLPKFPFTPNNSTLANCKPTQERSVNHELVQTVECTQKSVSDEFQILVHCHFLITVFEFLNS